MSTYPSDQQVANASADATNGSYRTKARLLGLSVAKEGASWI